MFITFWFGETLRLYKILKTYHVNTSHQGNLKLFVTNQIQIGNQSIIHGKSSIQDVTRHIIKNLAKISQVHGEVFSIEKTVLP